MKEITIRKPHKAELPEVYRLLIRLIPFMPMPEEAEWLERVERGDIPNINVAVINGKIAGVTVYGNPEALTGGDKMVFLHCLVVDETKREQGIGRTLVESLRCESFKKGACCVFWQCHRENQAAQAFYSKIEAENSDEWILYSKETM